MSGTGTMWSLMTEGAAAYGVRSEQINISQTEIKQHLDQGDIVICSVRQGDFTTGGHFILLYDYDDEDFPLTIRFLYTAVVRNGTMEKSEARSKLSGH